MRRVTEEELERLTNTKRDMSKADIIEIVDMAVGDIEHARELLQILNVNMGINRMSGGDPRRNKVRQLKSALNCLLDSFDVLVELVAEGEQ